ncbi:MAG TPA: hypothetical protein VI358_18145 [Pseudolabrys sp.]
MPSPTRKPQTLKDFSELKPIEERIALVASDLMVAFKGEAMPGHAPEAKTQVHRVWAMNKLDERQQIAWQTFMDDVKLARGKSGKVTSSYGDYVNNSSEGEFRIPTAYADSYYRRVERLFLSLGRRQRWLLMSLLQDALKARSSVTLETIGITRSGYKDKEHSRTAGVVQVQTLLDLVADYYGV